MQQDRRRVPIHTATELQGAAASGSSSGDARATHLSDDGSGFETRAFRETLGHYASGITIITSADDGGAFGFTCQSFHSVSVDPPLVSFNVQKISTTYPRLRNAGSFAVNILASDQQRLSDQFARSGGDKWKGVLWSRTRAGNPVLDGTLAWLDCQAWAEHEAGDHLIVLGRVKEMSFGDGRSKEPLLYYRGGYRQLRSQ